MPSLPRSLGLADATSIVAGTVIGAGIFLVPNLVARQLPSPGWILAVWTFSGILSFFGALAYAELGAMMPATGGHYVYLREIYGPFVAFLSGWTFLLIIVSGAIAWIATSFSIYLGHFLPLTQPQSRVVAVGLILALTAVNYCGAQAGALVQILFTGVKIGALFALVAAAFLTPAASAPAQPVTITPSAFGVAMISCLLTYDGWVSLSFVAGEIRRPAQILPRALLAGMTICAAVYLAANLAYLRLLSPAGIAASDRVAADVAGKAIGSAGTSLVAAAILISIVGAANGWILTAPRVSFAQASDGLFFRFFAAVHPRFQTPHRAILLQAAWASMLVITGSYAALAAFAMFASWLFYGLTVLGVLILRRKHPSRPRPYRVWGYPVTPLLFCLIAFGFILNTLITDPLPSLACLGILAAGIPAYLYWKR